MRACLILTALAAVILAGSAKAAAVGEAGPNFKFDKSWNFEEGIDEVQDLRGRVVLVERWATWCGPCMAQIPHLTELHHKYFEKGFVICSVSDEDTGTIQSKMIDLKKPPYGIVAAKIGTLYQTKGIPHGWVLDANGKILWEGHPTSLKEEEIEGWLKELAPTKVDKELAKDLSGAVKSFDKGEVGKAMTDTKKVAETATDDAVKSDCEYLLALCDKHVKLYQQKIDAAGDNLIVKAKAMEDGAAKLKGSEIGTKWDADVKELKKSKEFKDTQSAADDLAKLKPTLEDMKAATARKKLEALAKKYPTTPAGKEAAELAKNYGG